MNDKTLGNSVWIMALMLTVVLSLPEIQCKEEVVQAASTADIRVATIDFKGWKNAIRVSNALCSVVVAPSINRVMSFSLKDEQNVLWVNEATEGAVIAKDDATWHNMGGDKLWPAQQDLWVWPPPYQFDCGAATVEFLSGGVRLKSQISAKFGAYAIREFVLDPKRALLHVRQKLVKTHAAEAALTAWNITQIRAPDFAILPAAPVGGERYKVLNGKPAEPQVKLHKSVVSTRIDPESSVKIGVKTDAFLKEGWVAAVFGKTLLVESHDLKDSTSYPDGGCHAEIFTAPKELGRYIELELLSPQKALKAGEELVNDEIWQLITLDGAQVESPESAATAARAAHAEALNLLVRKEVQK